MTAHDTYLCWEQLELIAESLSPSERSALLRAGRGAELLDLLDPGWHERLLPWLSHLDMRDPHACVLGHLHGGYRAGLWDLGIEEEDARELGLEALETHDEWAREADYRALTEAWRTLCQARCAGRVAS